MTRELTPEAQAELDAFKNHLERHKGGFPDCRFCEQRSPTRLVAGGAPAPGSKGDGPIVRVEYDEADGEYKVRYGPASAGPPASGEDVTDWHTPKVRQRIEWFDQKLTEYRDAVLNPATSIIAARAEVNGALMDVLDAVVASRVPAAAPKFTQDDVTFLRYEARHAREQHGPLIAEAFDFDGIANRIEVALAAPSAAAPPEVPYIQDNDLKWLRGEGAIAARALAACEYVAALRGGNDG